MSFTCPVCAYQHLEFPAADFSICGCCGTEFGYDDRALSHAELTEIWVRNNCPWFDIEEPKPNGWNGYQQLIDGGKKWAVPSYAYKVEQDVQITPSGQMIVQGNVWSLRAA